MVVSGVRSSCEASAANWRTFCSERQRAPKACWIRSSMALMAPPSRPTSVLSSASGIRAVRSPREVICCAVLAIWLSGARPRPISQRPLTASSRISAPPVISSAMMIPPTWAPTAPTGRATTSTARVPPLARARISRATARSLGPAVVRGHVERLAADVVAGHVPGDQVLHRGGQLAGRGGVPVSGCTCTGRPVISTAT